MSVSFLLLLSSFVCYSTYCAMQVTVHVQHMHTHTYCHTVCTHTHTQCVRVAGHLEQSQCLSTVLHTVHVVYSALDSTHTCMTYIRARYIQCTQGTWCVWVATWNSPMCLCTVSERYMIVPSDTATSRNPSRAWREVRGHQ